MKNPAAGTSRRQVFPTVLMEEKQTAHARGNQPTNAPYIPASLSTVPEKPWAFVVTAYVEVIPIQKINEAYDCMTTGDGNYRFSINLASFRAG